MWRRAVSSWLTETPVSAAAAGVAEMPSPRGLPLLGTTLDLLAAGSAPRLHEYVDARHRKLGPVYRETIGNVRAVFVSDPNEMRRVFTLEGKCPVHHLPEPWVLYNQMYGCKRGLFFMNGDEWLHFRRIMNKLMLKSDSGLPVVQPCELVANDLVKSWKKKYAGRELMNLESELYRWATDIMIAVLLGDKKYHHLKTLDGMVSRFASVVHLIFQESARLSLVPAKLAASLRIPAWRNFVSAVNEALVLANGLVTKLVPECKDGSGLLGAMLEEGIEHNDVVRILADQVLAAGDTTAYSTQWMLYLLAKNKLQQEELYEEVQGVSNPEDIIQLPLLRAVMRETLRLYPVAPFLTRYLPQDSLIGGYLVPAGELVLLSMYTSGRDAKNFSKPNDFWPARWCRDGTTGNYKGVHSPNASLPFGMGVRSCVGRKIAEVQMTLAIARVVQQLKLELIEKEPNDMLLQLVAVPSRPIRLWLTER